jgi:hypothetical protein
MAMVALGDAALAQSLGELAGRGAGIPQVTVAQLACTDQPLSAPVAAPLRIMSGHSPDSREAFAAGQVVLLNGNTATGVLPGQRYFVRRVQPARQELLFDSGGPAAIRTAGWLTVIGSDDRFALARIDFACDAVLTGDYLETYVEPVVATPAAPGGPPRFENPATVLFGADRREIVAAGDLFSIDRGAAQGLAAATRIAVYRDPRNGGPLVPIGEGHIVDVSAESARAILTRVHDAVRSGDLVMLREP